MRKTAIIQSTGVRAPTQARAKEKVQLILEAATLLLEKGGLASLTTNAVADTAGVSIGSLYQYFPNKEAILDALADRETDAMASRLRAVMLDAAIASPGDRIAAIVAAVAASYGDRRGAHRLVMEHSLSRGSTRLASLLKDLASYLTQERKVGAVRKPLPAADAFVLVHAFAGVLRAMTTQSKPPPNAEVERSLARLVLHFVT